MIPLTLFSALLWYFAGNPAPAAPSDQFTAIQNLVAQGRFGEARVALSRALAMQPNDAALWNLFGIATAQQGKAAEAEEAFLKATRLAPRLESAWLNLGRLYQLSTARTEGIAKGIQAYETVLKLDPANAEAHHQLAVFLHWRGAFRESLAQINQLSPEDQSRRPALALRCANEAALGNTEGALALADQLLRQADLEEADVIAILPALESHNEIVALRLLQGVAARRLSTPETKSHLAALYERRGELSAARSAYESMVQDSRPSAKTLTDLARVAWKQKDFEGTLGYLAHARDLEPNNPGIHFFFGVTCNEMHLPVEARKSLEKALELAPENPYYNYAMGAVRLQWSESGGAIPFFKRYVGARPQDARGHLALATAYFSIDQYEDAKRELALVSGNAQTRAGSEYLLGRIAAQTGDLNGAIAHSKELVALDPASSEAHAELGDLLLQQQRLEDSHRETERALALDRNNYTANRTLMRLYRLANDPRVQQQVTRLKALTEDKDAKLRMLERTIEVRPW